MLDAVERMSDAEAEAEFLRMRWGPTNGVPTCPHCDATNPYQMRRRSGALLYRCRGCKRDFSPTSGTPFAYCKRPLRDYLAAIVLFQSDAAQSTLSAAKRLGVTYRTAFSIRHKMQGSHFSAIKAGVGA